MRVTGPEQAADYLRFFCDAVHGEEGPFSVIESREQVLRRASSTSAETGQAMHDDLVEGLRPVELSLSPGDGSGFCFEEIGIVYAGLLFRARMKVFPSGLIEMLEDNPTELKLEVLSCVFRRFDGVMLAVDQADHPQPSRPNQDD